MRLGIDTKGLAIIVFRQVAQMTCRKVLSKINVQKGVEDGVRAEGHTHTSVTQKTGVHVTCHSPKHNHVVFLCLNLEPFVAEAFGIEGAKPRGSLASGQGVKGQDNTSLHDQLG